MDLCKNCIVKGKQHDCEQTPCNMHSSWFVEQLRTENEQLKAERDECQKWANIMEETVDNVREAMGLESTHYLVLPSQVADVVEQNKQLRTVLKDVIEFSNNEAKSKRAEWAIKKARQALNAEGVGKCTCADHQGGPCASCMETKYNL